MAQCIYRSMSSLYQWIEGLGLNTLVPVVLCLIQVDKLVFRDPKPGQAAVAVRSLNPDEAEFPFVCIRHG
jgi:hypothetical protein